VPLNPKTFNAEMTLLLMQCFVMLHVSHGVIDVGTILLTDEQLVYVLEVVQGIISVAEQGPLH